jgi:hypothetical protein
VRAVALGTQLELELDSTGLGALALELTPA